MIVLSMSFLSFQHAQGGQGIQRLSSISERKQYLCFIVQMNDSHEGHRNWFCDPVVLTFPLTKTELESQQSKWLKCGIERSTFGWQSCRFVEVVHN